MKTYHHETNVGSADGNNQGEGDGELVLDDNLEDEDPAVDDNSVIVVPKRRICILIALGLCALAAMSIALAVQGRKLRLTTKQLDSTKRFLESLQNLESMQEQGGKPLTVNVSSELYAELAEWNQTEAECFYTGTRANCYLDGEKVLSTDLGTAFDPAERRDFAC